MSEKRSSLHQGNIFDSTADVICHQVNCLGVMGAGLAKEVRARFPQVYEIYHSLCTNTPPEQLLGLAFVVQTDNSGDKYIANCFGQKSISRDQQMTDYDALKKSLQQVAEYMTLYGLKTVAIPYEIGCGLGGGDWKVVRNIISEVFGTTDLFVEIWRLEEAK